MGHRKKGNKEGGEDIFLVDILYYCSHLNLKLQSLLDVALIGDVQFSLQFGFEKGHWVFHTVWQVDQQKETSPMTETKGTRFYDETTGIPRCKWFPIHDDGMDD